MESPKTSSIAILTKFRRVVERKFPWGIILLMGGGFALAEGASKSCLTHLVSSAKTINISLILVAIVCQYGWIKSVQPNLMAT